MEVCSYDRRGITALGDYASGGRVTCASGVNTDHCSADSSQQLPHLTDGTSPTALTATTTAATSTSLDHAGGPEPVRLGYQQCAMEAVRYLLEEEGLLADDPLVLGLQQHLWMQEQRLNVEHILNRYNDMMHELDSPVTDNDSDECDSAFPSDEEDSCDESVDMGEFGDADAEMCEEDYRGLDGPVDQNRNQDADLMLSLTRLASGFLLLPNQVSGEEWGARWPSVVTSTSQDDASRSSSPSPSL